MEEEPKKPKKPKKENKKRKEIKFSFSLEQFGKNTLHYFQYFKNFIEINYQNEQLNDQFLESPTLVEATKSYIEFVKKKDVKIKSKRDYFCNLKRVLTNIVETPKIKIQKKFLQLAIKKLASNEQKVSKKMTEKKKKTPKKNILLSEEKKISSPPKKEIPALNFSFTIRSLGRNSEQYFGNFKKFVLMNTHLETLDDHFFESQFFCDCTKNFIEFTQKRDIEKCSQKTCLSLTRTLFKRIIVNDNLKFDKKYLKIASNLIKESLNFYSGKKNFSEKKKFCDEKFFFENVIEKNFFVRFKNFVELKTGINEIDNGVFESQLIVDCTREYIQNIKFDKKIEKKTKNFLISSLKNFFIETVENQTLKINKKFLKNCVGLFEQESVSPLKQNEEIETKENLKKRKKKFCEEKIEKKNFLNKKLKFFDHSNIEKHNEELEFDSESSIGLSDDTDEEKNNLIGKNLEEDVKKIDLELKTIDNELKILELIKEKNRLELENLTN